METFKFDPNRQRDFYRKQRNIIRRILLFLLFISFVFLSYKIYHLPFKQSIEIEVINNHLINTEYIKNQIAQETSISWFFLIRTLLMVNFDFCTREFRISFNLNNKYLLKTEAPLSIYTGIRDKEILLKFKYEPSIRSPSFEIKSLLLLNPWEYFFEKNTSAHIFFSFITTSIFTRGMRYFLITTSLINKIVLRRLFERYLGDIRK